MHFQRRKSAHPPTPKCIGSLPPLSFRPMTLLPWVIFVKGPKIKPSTLTFYYASLRNIFFRTGTHVYLTFLLLAMSCWLKKRNGYNEILWKNLSCQMGCRVSIGNDFCTLRVINIWSTLPHRIKECAKKGNNRFCKNFLKSMVRINWKLTFETRS